MIRHVEVSFYSDQLTTTAAFHFVDGRDGSTGGDWDFFDRYDEYVEKWAIENLKGDSPRAGSVWHKPLATRRSISELRQDDSGWLFVCLVRGSCFPQIGR